MASTLLIDVGPAVGGHGQRGIGRYVRGLASSIALLPEDLTERIWALGFPGPTLESFGRHAVAVDLPMGLRWVPNWAAGWLAVRAALKRTGAAVFHATDPQRPWTDRGPSSIVTVYDLIPLREQGMLESWRLDHRLVYGRYLRQIEAAQRVVTISRATADEVQERFGIADDRIDIVYPAVVAPESFPRTDPVEPTFLFVGALDAHKQPELALQAFGRFHSRVGVGRLRYIGPSDRHQVQGLHDLATRIGIAPAVTFEGRIGDDDLEDAYAHATALLWTSRIEGFGLPPIEAVLRGVPVIAVRNPAATETLEGAAAIVPADIEAIAEAMTHPVHPRVEAVDLIRDRHSLASVARTLAESYRRASG